MNFEGRIIKDQLIKKFRIDRTILFLEHSEDLREYEWVVIPERITTIEELIGYLQSHLKIDLDLHLYFEDALLRPQLPVDVLRMSKSDVLVSPKTCMAADDFVEQSSSVFNDNKSTNSSYVQVNTDKDQTNNIVIDDDTAQSSRMEITRKECSVITENVPEQQSLILMEKMDEENSIAVPDSHIATTLDFANILVHNNATPHKAAVHSTSALADSGNSFSSSSDLKRKLNFTDKESPETEDCGPHSSKMCKTTIGADETGPELVSSSSSKKSVCFAPIPIESTPQQEKHRIGTPFLPKKFKEFNFGQDISDGEFCPLSSPMQILPGTLIKFAVSNPRVEDKMHEINSDGSKGLLQNYRVLTNMENDSFCAIAAREDGFLSTGGYRDHVQTFNLSELGELQILNVPVPSFLLDTSMEDQTD